MHSQLVLTGSFLHHFGSQIKLAQVQENEKKSKDDNPRKKNEETRVVMQDMSATALLIKLYFNLSLLTLNFHTLSTSRYFLLFGNIISGFCFKILRYVQLFMGIHVHINSDAKGESLSNFKTDFCNLRNGSPSISALVKTCLVNRWINSKYSNNEGWLG